MTFDTTRRWMLAAGGTVFAARAIRGIGRFVDDVHRVVPARADDLSIPGWRDIQAERLLDLPVADAVDLFGDDTGQEGPASPGPARDKLSHLEFSRLAAPMP